MKSIISLLVIFFLATSHCSAASKSIYLGVQGGYEHSKQDLSAGSQHLLYDENFTTLGVLLGADINSRFRTELSYVHKNAKEEIFDFRNEQGLIYPEDGKEKITQQTLLINLFFYPFHNKTIQPFIGAGAGIGWVDVKKMNNYQKFAYAGYLGVDYVLSEHFVVNLMGTYNSTGSYKYFARNKNWGATLGARFYF